MKFKAVLFDLDGTLLNTLDDLADSMNSALEQMGFPGHPVASYKVFVGDGVEVLVRRALPADHLDEATVTDCVRAMRREYDRRMFDKTRPYPGIPELLDGLTKKNVVLGVLSNKPDGPTRTIVGQMLPRWKFAAVAGQRPGVHKKPDPSGALAIARDLNLAPADFLYLGDTSTDMKTAVSAGMYPVGAAWGFRDERELRESGAKAVATYPTDVLPLID
jgi:phosphoglycolate phosphatase